MSTEADDPLYGSLHAWATSITRQTERVYVNDPPALTNPIHRKVIADQAREAARYLTALADRLELFNV